jgi:mitochondrial distribution and morphology protein 12
MSIDLEWAKLDSSLASYLVTVLNKQLSTADRPSFIGPVEVTSLDFGSNAPDVELVDLRDIYRDFLDDSDDESDGDPVIGPPVKVTEGADDDDGFEWVSRRAAREEPAPSAFGRHLAQHLHYGLGNVPGSPSGSMIMDYPWAAGGISSRAFASGVQRNPSGSSTNLGVAETLQLQGLMSKFVTSPESQGPPQVAQEQQQQAPHPNLQLHFLINWQSNLRITITTSLLINYPSPMFMSLPIKLSVTGLEFSGEVAVAYEGERRRIHLCILDDLDPYGPAGDRPKRESPLSNAPPPDLDDDDIPTKPSKPLPIGQRLLPSIVIESEIGQQDKHVLKNVTRIERFIQDVVRKTVEEELVFPNFHTLVMGDQ